MSTHIFREKYPMNKAQDLELQNLILEIDAEKTRICEGLDRLKARVQQQVGAKPTRRRVPAGRNYKGFLSGKGYK